MPNNRIIILDTTLRDGEQTAGVNFNLHDKLEIARQLEKLGVDYIEAGFPASSPGDFAAVQAVAQTVQCGVVGLCRAVPGDIKRAWEAIQHAKKPRLHIFIASSPVHMEFKLRMTPDQVVAHAVDAVKLGRSLCADIEFSPEDATRSDPQFLYRLIGAVIEAGATTINIPDTVGYAVPTQFAQLIQGIRANVPGMENVTLSVHCHDDLGMAVACSLSGVMAGARQVECTINGLGERAGNCAMEEVIMGINTRSDFYGLSHAINTRRIHRISRLVSSLSGIEVAPNKAIVGSNAFLHAAGIHQHGMLANAQTYEIMTPESVGLVTTGMVLGKLSGRHAFAEKLSDLGFHLEQEQIERAFVKFKMLADSKKEVSDRDIEALVSTQSIEVPEAYELVAFQIQSGNTIKPIASVTLRYKDALVSEAAVGDGPIHACFNAIDRCMRRDLELASYNIRAVTEGKDALGEVTARVSMGGAVFTGKGISTDIIESSVRAYINAANRAIADYELQQGVNGK